MGYAATESGDNHIFFWKKGRMTDLGRSADRAHAPTINSRGQVAMNRKKGQTATGFDLSHAFVWGNGRIRDLGTLGGPASEVIAINDQGQVVGWSDSTAKDGSGDAVGRWFLWQQGRMANLGAFGDPTLGDWASKQAAINQRGQVVGSNWHSEKERGFVWERGKVTFLGTLPCGKYGPRNANAISINNRSEVVGQSENGTDHRRAVLWMLRSG